MQRKLYTSERQMRESGVVDAQVCGDNLKYQILLLYIKTKLLYMHKYIFTPQRLFSSCDLWYIKNYS